MHTCGGNMICDKKRKLLKRQRNQDQAIACVMYASFQPEEIKKTKIKVWSAYYGEVELQCQDLKNGTIQLCTSVNGSQPGQPNIDIMSIDCQLNELNPNRYLYTYEYLLNLPIVVVCIETLKINNDLIVKLKLKQKENNKLPKEDQVLLHDALVYNSRVDDHYAKCQFIKFCHRRLKVNNVVPTNLLISLVNYHIDNAYWTGRYIVVGNGVQLSEPFATFDIIGHELGHGLIQSTANLIMKGHAGALNESYADIIGTAFERYVYNKRKNENKNGDLQGKFDWLIGEDKIKKKLNVRNMEDPTKSTIPQPIKYKGEFWKNPNADDDNGFVHVNNGPWNHAFFDFSQKVTIMAALDIFLNALKLFPSNCSFPLASTLLLQVCPEIFKVELKETLAKIGLDDSAVSDWIA